MGFHIHVHLKAIAPYYSVFTGGGELLLGGQTVTHSQAVTAYQRGRC